MRTICIEQREKINEIIKSCKICQLAVSAFDIPYILPMNFALEGDMVILHSAQSGRMWETIKQNPKVCINWTNGDKLTWQDERVGCSYGMVSVSAIVEGTAAFVDDFHEKERCLRQIMAQYSDREFKFNAPAVKNVGIIKVHIEKITGRKFGEKVLKQ
jgi:uncharacterized protein